MSCLDVEESMRVTESSSPFLSSHSPFPLLSPLFPSLHTPHLNPLIHLHCIPALIFFVTFSLFFSPHSFPLFPFLLTLFTLTPLSDPFPSSLIRLPFLPISSFPYTYFSFHIFPSHHISIFPRLCLFPLFPPYFSSLTTLSHFLILHPSSVIFSPLYNLSPSFSPSSISFFSPPLPPFSFSFPYHAFSLPLLKSQSPFVTLSPPLHLIVPSHTHSTSLPFPVSLLTFPSHTDTFYFFSSHTLSSYVNSYFHTFFFSPFLLLFPSSYALFVYPSAHFPLPLLYFFPLMSVSFSYFPLFCLPSFSFLLP